MNIESTITIQNATMFPLPNLPIGIPQELLFHFVSYIQSHDVLKYKYNTIDSLLNNILVAKIDTNNLYLLTNDFQLLRYSYKTNSMVISGNILICKQINVCDMIIIYNKVIIGGILKYETRYK